MQRRRRHACLPCIYVDDMFDASNYVCNVDASVSTQVSWTHQGWLRWRLTATSMQQRRQPVKLRMQRPEQGEQPSRNKSVMLGMQVAGQRDKPSRRRSVI